MNDSCAPRSKSDLRVRLLDARAHRQASGPGAESVSEAFRRLLGEHIIRHTPSEATVCAYLPTSGEPPIESALEEVHASGRRILVPVTRPGRLLDWTAWTPTVDVVESRFGIREPVGPRYGPDAFVRADLRLIPALAVDRSGFRLGYGGGFYDAALSAVPSVPRPTANVGVCFAAEVLEAGSVPTEPHDARLDLVCTERGFTRIGNWP
ncbi:MAG: 5-formyltetrahydrofolate cyclo-ligase [Kocuria sp.]|nr:5-formyltetrahydrofolate cyclo-ligase [Kocuria sp.]MDN5617510.1 5-formyltetrahydrofolate cyclo-ligase [Kocuria sp.]